MTDDVQAVQLPPCPKCRRRWVLIFHMHTVPFPIRYTCDGCEDYTWTLAGRLDLDAVTPGAVRNN